MRILVGTWDKGHGHTWIVRGFGKIYALRSLPGGSSLCVTDEDSPECSDGGIIVCRPEGSGWKEFPTKGEHSCHAAISGHSVIVSDYTSGTLSIYHTDSCGMPLGEAEIMHFHGSGPVKGRQDGPHVHSSWLSPDAESLVVADLGSDALYRFPVENGNIRPEKQERFTMPAGCGPRHCAFGGGVLYVSTELSDEVIVLDWPSMAVLQRICVNPALPGGGGHVALSPDGRHLYVSSRLKNDGIGIFSVRNDGLLEKTGYVRTGAHPRHFCLSPDGLKLFAACRDENAIEIYRRSEQDGSLADSGERIRIAKPVFVEAYEENRL